MKKLLFIAISLVGMMGTTQAQYYKNALGVRLNHGHGGITYKYFTSSSKALDLTLDLAFSRNIGTASSSGVGIGLTGLFETHKPTPFAPRLNWYYGYGAHVSLYGRGEGSTIGFGVDGVIGLEYVAEAIPFAFSVDYIPSLSIINSRGAGGSTYFEENFQHYTIGVKYTFLKSDAEKKREEELKKNSSPK